MALTLQSCNPVVTCGYTLLTGFGQFFHLAMFFNNVGLCHRVNVNKNVREAQACHAHEEMWFVGVVFTQAEPILRLSFNSCVCSQTCF